LESALLSTQMRVEGVAAVSNILRDMDRKVANKVRANMRASIIPVAREIANDVPETPPLSGMGPNTRRGGNAVNGVTRWTGVPKASVAFTPGRGRGGGTRILSMKFTGGSATGGGLGFDYAELAGNSSRPGSKFTKVYEKNGIPGFQHRVNGQGQSFIRGIRKTKPIRGKAGYFVFDSAVKRYKGIEGLGKRAIENYMQDATQQINRLRAAL
jgi:hypothetical protein